jgi:glutaredoxin
LSILFLSTTQTRVVSSPQVDLSFHPYRRLEMLNNNDGDGSLPQLHVNGRPLGTVDEIQEWEDWGELSKILGGASPGKLAADAAAKFVAEMQHQEQQQQQQQKLRQQSEGVHPES